MAPFAFVIGQAINLLQQQALSAQKEVKEQEQDIKKIKTDDLCYLMLDYLKRSNQIIEKLSVPIQSVVIEQQQSAPNQKFRNDKVRILSFAIACFYKMQRPDTRISPFKAQDAS